MRLSSPAFEDGEHMPEKYGNTTENVNPPLEIRDVPEEAESLVLIMDDPDAKEPAGKIWEHWTVWNIPTNKSEIPEDWNPKKAVEGMTDFRDTGYGGPNPPDGTHTYRFQLYAIDTELDLDEEAGKEEVLEAVEGHVVEKTLLQGKFDPL
ncbi:YbhB/YbcL family Raf kinase inhibitor-like protein [Candidatus Nanohaloarchaea archaeon]|nr:YbhB/YbcL family Raf kinase inhibitor-like protein [Candidatus Nanohaloarchaea archaeon]